MLTMRIARAYAKGVEIGTFKPFDFEGFGELFRNFSELLGNFWGTFGELLGNFWGTSSKLQVNFGSTLMGVAGRETRPLRFAGVCGAGFVPYNVVCDYLAKILLISRDIFRYERI